MAKPAPFTKMPTAATTKMPAAPGPKMPSKMPPGMPGAGAPAFKKGGAVKAQPMMPTQTSTTKGKADPFTTKTAGRAFKKGGAC